MKISQRPNSVHSFSLFSGILAYRRFDFLNGFSLRVSARISILVILFLSNSSTRLCAQEVLSELTAINRTSSSSVSPGSTLGFSYALTQGTNVVNWVAIYFQDSTGVTRIASNVSPSGSSGSVTKAVASDWLNGTYAIKHVILGDTAGRFITYYRDGSVSGDSSLTAHNLNLASLDFVVTGGVSMPPSITTQPASQTVRIGVNVVFSTVANSTASMNYQWLKNSIALNGSTNPTLSLSSVQESDSGNYAVVVSNSLGSITSSAAVLVVSNAPIFVTHPINVTANSGGSFSANVQVNTANLAVVTWSLKLNGRTLAASASATVQNNNSITASVSFGPVSLVDAGNFQIVATNSYGFTLSEERALVVLAAPFVTLQPLSQNIPGSSPVIFTVIAGGLPAPTYQWRKNGVAISGATGSSYMIARVVGSDAGSYTVVTTNSMGSVTSNVAVLTTFTAAPTDAVISISVE